MAKKWTPSLKQLSLYDELLKRQNITRKRLLKRRRIAEQEGSSFGRPLPDLVLPMKVKRFRNVNRYANRFDSYEEYRRQIKALQELYGKGKEQPDFAYYKQTYKKNILSLFYHKTSDGKVEGWISDFLNFNEKPAGNFGKYSDEQKQKVALAYDEDGVKFLELYNKLVSMSLGEFMGMYDSGFIPKLRYIYDEMRGVGANLQLSYVDEFLDSYSDYRRQVRKGVYNIMYKDVSERISSLKSSGKGKTGKYESRG